MSSSNKNGDPLYSYEPLRKEREFRILQVLGDNEANHVVRCRLNAYSLRECFIHTPGWTAARLMEWNSDDNSVPNITFEALTWTWGSEKQSEAITVEEGVAGKKVSYRYPVTPNLYLALKCLRPKNSNETRNLWIDAICINQKDDWEKSIQVSMMPEIFNQAANVCVWLGKHADDSETAMELIQSVLGDLALSAGDNVHKQFEANSKAFTALMHRRWFSRRWIIQEISLAKTATVHCEHTVVPWANLEAVIELFEGYIMEAITFYRSRTTEFWDASILEEIAAIPAIQLVKAKKKLMRREDGQTFVEYYKTVGELVPELIAFEATLDHDMIYAILALARDTRPGVATQDAFEYHTGPRHLHAEAVVEVEIAPTSNDSAANLCTGQNNRSVDNEFGTPISGDVKRRHPQDPDAEGRPPKKMRLDSTGSSHCSSYLGEYAAAELRRVNSSKNLRIFQVNYEQPFFDVCRQFLEVTINNSRWHNLDILCRPWAPAKAKDTLPSWVASARDAPFGRRKAASGPIGLQITRKNFDSLVGGFGSQSSYYNACLGQERQHKDDWKFGSDRNVFVKGFILDQVELITPSSPLGSIPAEWFQLVGWLPWEEHPGDPPEKFWRTLIGDRGSDGVNAELYYKDLLVFASGFSTPENGLQLSDLIQCRHKALLEFLRRMKGVVFNRSMLRTKRRKYLGLAPKSARMGDCKSRDFRVISFCQAVTDNFVKMSVFSPAVAYQLSFVENLAKWTGNIVSLALATFIL